ncbi:hypothetical protein CCACVL1_13783 [Corchorus capsularis]|uniref:Uncharacterized protein n=1 Tax=Corchorus capsularis TaxID=210143 RepID=A0A1R3I9R0_COCAP|nr:hypothetical protein CCACVL1_13783 [Corchorus capsularis]
MDGRSYKEVVLQQKQGNQNVVAIAPTIENKHKEGIQSEKPYR